MKKEVTSTSQVHLKANTYKWEQQNEFTSMDTAILKAGKEKLLVMAQKMSLNGTLQLSGKKTEM